MSLSTPLSASIAAGHQKTAEAAALIIKEGGNAFDAAIAALFAASVAEPCMASLGAGGFACLHTAAGQNLLLDFFVQTPLKKIAPEQLEFYPMQVDFGSAQETFHIGMGAMATPGMMAGISALHQRYASLPISVLIEPAKMLAKEGLAMTDFQFFDIQVLQPIMTRSEESAAIFYPDGQPLPVGQIQRMPGLADYFDYLSHEKDWAKDIYLGEAAKLLLKDSIAQGGLLRAEDLAQYEVAWRKPLQLNYKGHHLLTNPLPSTGGVLIAEGLSALEPLPIDPLYTKQQLARLQKVLGDIYSIDRNPKKLNSKWGSTTHLNIADELGNAISITLSNGEGCGYMIPGTNIMMNNMLGEAALLPDGFHNWMPNSRLSSMMAPTLVLKENQFHLATGTGGASRIPGMVLQLLHHVLDQKMELREATAASRLHYEHGRLNLEPEYAGLANTEDPKLEQLVEWPEKAMFFGGLNSILHQKNGRLQAAGDDRREGYAIEL